MAITNGYLTLANYKATYAIDSTDTTDDGAIERLIELASRYIDDKTGRTFYTRTATKYYDYPQSRKLKLDDDLLGITTLTNGDSTEIANTEYHLLPYNNPPYYIIKLTDVTTTYWQRSSAGSTEKIIQVAGTWGYASSCPNDIEEITAEIVKNAYNRRFGENMSGTATITGAGVVITPSDISGIAKDVINHYRRRF